MYCVVTSCAILINVFEIIHWVRNFLFNCLKINQKKPQPTSKYHFNAFYALERQSLLPLSLT